MSWLQNFINFLQTDVKDENETKEMAVLLRIMCCIFIIYFFVIGITIASLKHYILGLLCVGAIGLLVGAFILTYENHTIGGNVMLNSVLLFFPAIFGFFMGYSMDFHIMTFLNILIVYYNKTEHMYVKRFYTFGLGILLIFLAEIYEGVGLARVPSGAHQLFIQSFNIFIFTTSIGIIAYSYCGKFNNAEEKLKRINENLERMANIDPLTNLSNRRHMNEHMEGLLYEFNHSGKIFTIAIGDIDFFKKVNDTYGHDTGDYVLSSVAAQFTKHMKGKGHVARWGGEEFLFTFENMNIDAAAASLNELRKTIEKMPMHFKEYDFHITMSFGMEEFNDRLGVEATINRADDKLYKAKQGGRNRVVTL